MSKYLPTLFGRDDIFSIMESEVNDILNKFFQPRGCDTVGTRTYPKMDVYQHKQDLIIEASVPFVEKEDIKVTVEPSKEHIGYHIFTLSGSTTNQHLYDKDKPGYLLKELRRSNFTRRVLLESNLIEKCPEPTADMKDGILTVTFKDVYKEDPAALPKEIKIG